MPPSDSPPSPQFEETLAAGGVDLILADFQLPAFEGITAFLLARQTDPDVPFIMFTGKPGEKYAIDTLALGVTDQVLKQRLASLAFAVRHALEQQRERRQRSRRKRRCRRRQEQLEARNADLALANRDLELFVASASHDLRTPLVVTDSGRDLLGDDVPDDELNRATAPGQHFGFTFCHAGDVPDPELGAARHCASFVPPEVELGAHVAALGVRFYDGAMFPTDYRGSILIAEHGSWNRSSPVGYR